MSPEQFEKICQCIRASGQAANLVPWREVFSRTVTLPTPATAQRVMVKLEPTEETRAYVAVIQPRPGSCGGDEPAAALYRVMHGGGAAQALEELLAGIGQVIPAGGDHSHAIPGWARQWWIDFRGVEQSDTTTGAQCVVNVTVYELVGAMRQERC